MFNFISNRTFHNKWFITATSLGHEKRNVVILTVTELKKKKEQIL